jgi:Synergist-CTERM protein sorting domain-containing protein
VPFNNVTALHAHELIQIITDLELPLGSAVARPVAWYSNQGNNIDSGNLADVCNNKTATVAGMVVEKGWSNKLASCIASAAAPLPVCDGSTSYCRQCSAADNGQASGCNGAHPLCETDARNIAYGECVACATSADCSGATPVCAKGGTSNDTCRACASDAECAGNPAGPRCLASGACGAAISPDAGTDGGSPDAGTDGGSPDAGTSRGSSSSGCSSAGAAPLSIAAVAALAALLLRRRRSVA